MVNRMGGPCQIHTVHEAMFPIIGEVCQHHADHHSDPIDFDIENSELEGVVKCCHVKRTKKQDCQSNEEPQRDVIGDRVAKQRPGQLLVNRVSGEFECQKGNRKNKEPVVNKVLQPFQVAGTDRRKKLFHNAPIIYHS